ncbi:putative DsbA family dithiol-disulfide isomerase [Paraburkholderia sp. BL6665CI2N2]|uniref:DsbA family oxidoreductase n=1 Tax=Paraburkholderia sp. BL6665CI2N2 TaxID=1938806 RepID=UPI0010E9539A|nr:DsbA family oxidoreductase [Paraburkholderia sp. BL6665CI2N2]TDY21389.1 putative DsbA family dithiol-disulfide isomerase [Paraburkholderia sp. BL6665CI2N2]
MNLSDQMWAAQAAREPGERPFVMIEVVFDFICPWCLIGKRNLGTAVSRFTGLRPDVQVKVLWRSRQLLPYTPLDGLPYQAFYRDRLGSPDAVAARRAQVQRAGHDAGIEFAFDRIEVLPNTAAAHNVSYFAASRGNEFQRAALIDRLFTAYFMEGANIGDRQVLERIGLECGLEQQGLKDHLTEPGRLADPTGRRVLHTDPQVSGVPHFLFNAGYSLSGAHSPDAFIRAMELAIQS